MRRLFSKLSLDFDERPGDSCLLHLPFAHMLDRIGG